MIKLMTLILITMQLLIAKDYALIVGIGEYRESKLAKLKNSHRDIENYNKILEYWHIEHPIKLINADATKERILNQLATIAKRAKKGDRFFMFFSGHGTSLYDENYSQLLQSANLTNLMVNSGAILPYDFNPHDISQTIIIGKRDLKPYLQKIDQKEVKALIVFDACFSENSIRNRQNKFINRTPNILTNNSNYPYKNILYIASSITQSQSGKFSPILRDCLNQNVKLSKLKLCINKKIGTSMQIPAILTNSNQETLFH